MTNQPTRLAYSSLKYRQNVNQR